MPVENFIIAFQAASGQSRAAGGYEGPGRQTGQQASLEAPAWAQRGGPRALRV